MEFFDIFPTTNPGFFGFGTTPNFLDFGGFEETTPGFFGFPETTQRFFNFQQTTPNFFFEFNQATTQAPYYFTEKNLTPGDSKILKRKKSNLPDRKNS